jgi:hypothetical protein
MKVGSLEVEDLNFESPKNLPSYRLSFLRIEHPSALGTFDESIIKRQTHIT